MHSAHTASGIYLFTRQRNGGWAVSKFNPDLVELGALLKNLRLRTGLSGRKLGEYAGVSGTQIGDLETAEGGYPSSTTLRKLAHGLSITDRVDLQFDEKKADALFVQLMQSAGYLRGVHDIVPDADEDDVVKFLVSRSGDQKIADRLIKLAGLYPSLSDETQTVVRSLLGVWTKDSEE